jgi:hypothetical protein
LASPRQTDTWSHRSEREKVIKGVKSGRMYVKWGNLEEYMLNWVKDVTKLILGGKKWNSLYWK